MFWFSVGDWISYAIFQEDACCRYKIALRKHPGCPPQVRLGIAFCHFYLGRPKLAEAAFHRTLAMEPFCTSAYIGLAVLSLNTGTKAVSLQNLSCPINLRAPAGGTVPSDESFILVLHACLTLLW